MVWIIQGQTSVNKLIDVHTILDQRWLCHIKEAFILRKEQHFTAINLSDCCKLVVARCIHINFREVKLSNDVISCLSVYFLDYANSFASDCFIRVSKHC